MKTAVFMAAGTGSRFGRHTEKMPKGFVDTCGRPMIVQSIENLMAAGIERIIIGTGYHSEFYDKLAETYPSIECIKSDRYRETNSMYTLYNCRKRIDSDFLLLESDLIYEKRALDVLLSSPRDNVMLASSLTNTRDEYFIQANTNGELVAVSTVKSELASVYGEFVGIHKISYPMYKKMCELFARIMEEKPNLGYEFVMAEASAHTPCFVEKIDDLAWCEIDDEIDLAYAEEHICPKLKEMKSIPAGLSDEPPQRR